MQIWQILVAAAFLATVSFVVSGQPGFTFYKLSLQWPPSACTSQKECIENIPERFTIHGLWPQLPNDRPVRPYKKDNTCTEITPTPADIIADKLKPIQNELKANWPNLFVKKGGTPDDLGFWKYEWEQHGMCSDNPNDTKSYFDLALNLHRNLSDLQKVMGINPGDTKYRVSQILENVKQNVGVYPQIAVNSEFQLWEIRFCYRRGGPACLEDCPNKLETSTVQIKFPSAPGKVTERDEYSEL